MNRFVPLEKRSKRAQRQVYAARRGSWNGVNPVSKVIPSGKAYRRCKNRIDWDGEPPRSSRHEDLGGLCLLWRNGPQPLVMVLELLISATMMAMAMPGR